MYSTYREITIMELKVLSCFKLGPPRPDTAVVEQAIATGEITKDLPHPDSFFDRVESRRKICGLCEHSTYGKVLVFVLEAWKCGICGCPIASKTLIPMSHCPLGKW